MNQAYRTGSPHEIGNRDPRTTGDARSPDGNGFAESLQDSVRRAEPRLREIIASHPLPVLFGALATGYVLARLLRGSDR